MKFNFNAHRLAHFCILALFSWIGGQWLLVYGPDWTQPWMAYTVSCTAVTQFSNLILKLLLVNDDKKDTEQRSQDQDAAAAAAAASLSKEQQQQQRSMNNNKKKNKKKKDHRQ